MIIKIEVLATVKDNGTFNITEGKGKKTHFEVDEDNGMEMTLITVTETTGIETPAVKATLTGVEDGIIVIEVKDIVIGAEGEDGIQSAISRSRVSTTNPIFKPTSLLSTTYGTSIQIPNPI